MRFAANASAPRLNLAMFAFIALLLFLAVFSGFFAAVLPWWIVAMVLVLPMLGVTALAWPYLGLLGLVVLVSGMVPSSFLPQIGVGAGKLLGSDMALGVVLGLICLKMASSNEVRLKQVQVYLKPIALFILCIPLGVAVGYLLYRTEVREVLNEARIHIYWLFFFAPLYLATCLRDINRVAWGLVAIGISLAIMVILQFALGIQLLENARVENLRTLGGTYSDVTRSTAGGAIYFIIFAVYFVAARMLSRTLHPLIAIPLIAILAAGIVATFGRGIWLATAIGLCFIAWHLGGLRSLQKIIILMIVGAVLGLASLAAIKPAVIDAAVDRFTSTFAEGDHRSSLGERFEENEFAIKKIVSSPLFGIGFGTAYKPRLDINLDWNQVRYIHNGYLGLWLKLGLPGLIAAGWLVVVVFRRGRALIKYRELDPKSRALVTASVFAFLVPVMTSITQPEWLTMLGVSFFALVVGLIATIDRVTQQPATSNS
ncbi:MAG: O-antigen ligase family protein [Pseudomonadota bacterium]